MKRETVVGVKHGRSRWQGGGDLRSQISDLRFPMESRHLLDLRSEIWDIWDLRSEI
jgi:hypothetical protein